MSDTSTDNQAALLQFAEALKLNPEEAAELLLEGMVDRESPTVHEYLTRVEFATTGAAARTYATYWHRLDEAFGDRCIHQVRTSDLEMLLLNMPSTKRKSGRGGYQAKRTAVQAWRKVWSCAENDNLIPAGSNPAAKIPMPRRKPVNRRGLTPDEVTLLFDFASSTGNDPSLDALLIRFHVETGARRAGAINLRRASMDDKRRTVTLIEKGDNEREMPISVELWKGMVEHYSTRGRGEANVFRYKSGDPLTRRRYNYLFERIQGSPPFPAAKDVSAHWLRHTAITWMERAGGEAVAAQFAGHALYRSPVTGLYTTAPTSEVVQVWSRIWGDDHPLAN